MLKLNRFSSLLLILSILSLISAVFFISTVEKFVFDDIYNSADINRYVVEGISTETIVAQINPAGPGSYIWMSIPASIIGNNLIVYRIGALFSWVFLVFFIFAFKYNSERRRWGFACLLPTLIFPHSATAMATVLTEGPAMLFAITGFLLWIDTLVSSKVNKWYMTKLFFGAAGIGISIVSRQYYFALIPAMGLLILIEFKKTTWKEKHRFIIGFSSIVFSLLPLLYLYLIWGGLTSPGMENGTSYEGVKITTGLNWSRPFVVLFYISIYFIPFTTALWSRTHREMNRLFCLISLVWAITISLHPSLFLQLGPLKTLTNLIGESVQYADYFFLAIIGFIGCYNGCLMISALSRKKEVIKNDLPIVFSLLFIIFFVLENLAVGGNIGFYERYVLQVTPFMGVVAYSFYEKINTQLILICALMFIVSNMMLWRFGFQ